MDEATAGRYARSQRLVEMVMFARYGAKFLFELEFYGNLQGAGARYKQTLEAYTLLRTDMRRAEHDVDPFFYVTDYLTAWYMQHQVEYALNERFGPRWFAEPRAAEFLKTLWHLGNSQSSTELCQTMGFPYLNPKFLESYLRGS